MPVRYKKDVRSGEGFIKKEAAETKAKNKPPPRARQYASIAHEPFATVSANEATCSAGDTKIMPLGNVRLHVGPASDAAMRTALEDTSQALHTLMVIVQMMQQSIQGGESG